MREIARIYAKAKRTGKGVSRRHCGETFSCLVGVNNIRHARFLQKQGKGGKGRDNKRKGPPLDKRLKKDLRGQKKAGRGRGGKARGGIRKGGR